MPSLKTYFASIGAVAVLLAAAYFATGTWLALGNTPGAHPEWIFTKIVSPGMPGSDACKNSPRMLQGGAINLHENGGYHEVLYHQPLAPKRVSFRFYVEDDAYVQFMIYSQNGSFEGFRFSGWEDQRSAWITGFRNGRFKNVTTGNPAIFYPFQWHEVTLSFENNMMSMYVDEKPIGEFFVRAGIAQIGFRAGLGKARVDDVFIETAEGIAIREDFSNDAGLREKFVAVAAGFAAIYCALIFLLRLRMKKEDAFNLAFAASSAILLASVLSYHYYRGDFAEYLPADAAQGRPAAAAASNKGCAAAFEKKYSPQPGNETARVLFLGGGQTAGEGSVSADGGLVYFVGRYLPQVQPEFSAYVMNGACRGADMRQLLALYKDTFLPYAPDIVVLNTGAEETADASFRGALDELIELNKANGIRTILVLQAVSPEDPRGWPPTHELIRAAAEKHGVPLVDACARLWKHSPPGFLFWDYTVPTDHGHDMIAQAILPTLQAAIKEIAAEGK